MAQCSDRSRYPFVGRIPRVQTFLCSPVLEAPVDQNHSGHQLVGHTGFRYLSYYPCLLARWLFPGAFRFDLVECRVQLADGGLKRIHSRRKILHLSHQINIPHQR